MPGPYNPPNPYGQYFSFGEVENAAMASFMPFASGGFSPGSLSMMGRGVGGFNPTPHEYILHRMQNEQAARYMADVYKGDPRTASFTNLALQAMFGADQKRRQATIEKLGGMGNIQEIVGYALSQPGISGYLGGSASSLGIGAYALAGSGLGVNNRLMYGDGPLQQMMARSIMSQIQSRFYTSAGAPNTSMTQGLNRDQIGGMMAMMASQGAFTGLNLGNIQNNQFQANSGAINNIVNTVKNGAKALSAIVDVYGDASVAELFSKAQKITGLNFSSPANAELMSRRLGQLRNAGTLAGIDVQTMFDASAMGVSMAGSLGLVGHAAAYAGSVGAMNAAVAARRVATGRSFTAGGYLPTMQEMQAGFVRDIAGMMHDPIGMRMGLLQLIMAQGGVGSKEGMAEIEGLMAGAGAGGFQESTIDTIMRRHGFDMPQLIRQFGGSEGIQRSLNGEMMNKLGKRFDTEMDSRARALVRNRLMGGVGASESAMFLMENLKQTDIENLLKATKNKDPGAAMDAALKDSTAARRHGSGAMREAALAVVSANGDANTAILKMNLAHMAMMNDPIMRRFYGTVTDVKAETDMAAMAARPFMTDRDRGFLKRGLMEGFMDAFGGTNDKSAIARMMINTPGLVAGGQFGLLMPGINGAFNQQQMAVLAQAMQKEFRGSAEGIQMLASLGLTDERGNPLGLNEGRLQALHSRLTDPTRRSLLFENFREITFRDAQGQVRSAFAPTSAVERNKEFGGLVDVAAAVKLSRGKPDALSDYMESIAMTAIAGDKLFRKVQGGRLIGTGREMSSEEIQRASQDVIDRATQRDVLGKMSASTIAQLAKTSNQFGQAAAEVLARTEADLFGQKGNEVELAEIKSKREALAKSGFHAKEAPMKIMGTLKLVGDRELELVASGSGGTK